MGYLRSASVHPETRQLFRAVAVCGFVPTAASSDSDGNPSETDRSPSGRAGNRTRRAGTEDSEHLRGHRSLDKTAWRKDSEHLINKIARATGEGYGGIRLVYEEIYRSIESRAGVSLNTRLTNKRNRMAGEGVCKSKRDKLTRIDIIAEDKKLIEIYVAIVKELAVKYGVCA